MARFWVVRMQIEDGESWDIGEANGSVILPTFPGNLGEYYSIGKVKTKAYYEKYQNMGHMKEQEEGLNG